MIALWLAGCAVDTRLPERPADVAPHRDLGSPVVELPAFGDVVLRAAAESESPWALVAWRGWALDPTTAETDSWFYRFSATGTPTALAAPSLGYDAVSTATEHVGLGPMAAFEASGRLYLHDGEAWTDIPAAPDSVMVARSVDAVMAFGVGGAQRWSGTEWVAFGPPSVGATSGPWTDDGIHLQWTDSGTLCVQAFDTAGIALDAPVCAPLVAPGEVQPSRTSDPMRYDILVVEPFGTRLYHYDASGGAGTLTPGASAGGATGTSDAPGSAALVLRGLPVNAGWSQALYETDGGEVASRLSPAFGPFVDCGDVCEFTPVDERCDCVDRDLQVVSRLDADASDLWMFAIDPIDGRRSLHANPVPLPLGFVPLTELEPQCDLTELDCGEDLLGGSTIDVDEFISLEPVLPDGDYGALDIDFVQVDPPGATVTVTPAGAGVVEQALQWGFSYEVVLRHPSRSDLVLGPVLLGEDTSVDLGVQLVTPGLQVADSGGTAFDDLGALYWNSDDDYGAVLVGDTWMWLEASGPLGVALTPIETVTGLVTPSVSLAPDGDILAVQLFAEMLFVDAATRAEVGRWVGAGVAKETVWSDAMLALRTTSAPGLTQVVDRTTWAPVFGPSFDGWGDALSPDGGLLFRAEAGEYALYDTVTFARTPKTLVNPPDLADRMGFTPDGQTLLYLLAGNGIGSAAPCEATGGCRLYEEPLDGSAPAVILPHRLFGHVVVGREVTYVGRNPSDTSSGLYRYDFDLRTETLVAPLAVDAMGEAVGSRLVVVDGGTLRVFEADGTETVTLAGDFDRVRTRPDGVVALESCTTSCDAYFARRDPLDDALVPEGASAAFWGADRRAAFDGVDGLALDTLGPDGSVASTGWYAAPGQGLLQIDLSPRMANGLGIGVPCLAVERGPVGTSPNEGGAGIYCVP